MKDTNDMLYRSRSWKSSRCRFFVVVMWMAAWLPLTAHAQTRMLTLELQRRDPQTGVITTTQEAVSSDKVAIVMIDFWNYHWCATWVGRAGVMIPRMNQALVEARKLGMTVVHAPTDCSGGHAGTPQREAMAGLAPQPLPKLSDFNPPAPWGLGFSGGCMCGGPYPCYANYGWTREDPRLIIADTDFVSSGPRELNNLCVSRGIKHLIYTGGAANMCLLQKQEAMLAMIRHGYHAMVARDITEAHSEFTAPGSADRATEKSVEYIEKHIGPSIHLIDELRKAGCWDESALVDAPILVPWGFKLRPKFFDTTLTVSLSIPRLPGAEIRYTTDGTEPTAQSALYARPDHLEQHHDAALRTVSGRTPGRPGKRRLFCPHASEAAAAGCLHFRPQAAQDEHGDLERVVCGAVPSGPAA